jgi:phage FluMu gp28-like protein
MRLEDEFLGLDENVRRAHIQQWYEKKVQPFVQAMDKRKPSYYGQDFGRSSDLSVIAVGQPSQQLTLEVRVMVELSNVPFGAQEQIADLIIADMPRFSFGAVDGVGNGAALGEHIVARWSTAESVKTSIPWYAENLPKLKARFEDSTIRIPKDLDVKQDLSMLEVIDGVPRLPKRRVESQRRTGEKRHGDSAIALAMLEYAFRQGAFEIGYKKVPKRGGHFSYEGIL